MISDISIENFKVFKDKVEFRDLQNLNFLTGINGRGKSTMLQAFATLGQSLKETDRLDVLCLNGTLTKLGNAIDVKNEDISREKPIVFGFVLNGTRFELSFIVAGDNEQVLHVKEAKIDGIATQIDHRFSELFGLLKNLTFISAERIGPKLHYDFCNDSNYIGSKGEYTACAFYNHKDDVIADEIIDGITDIFPETGTEDIDRSFAGQVQFWLSSMFRPIFIKAEYISSVNEYTLQFGAPDRAGKYKPTNVGFGYSYALPIIVGALLAKPGSILIIENPEAHLHPFAQSILTKFLALVSKTGVQIFIETHSEHIVNAPRVMTVQDSFDSKNMKILYFDETYRDKHTAIDVADNGEIGQWPRGFFDQAEIDNDIILGL